MNENDILGERGGTGNKKIGVEWVFQ